MLIEDALIRSGIRQYIKTVYGAIPKRLEPGKDPLHFWGAPKFVKSGKTWESEKGLIELLRKEDKTPGKDTFSYVPNEQTFKQILSDIGIKPGHSVIHPYAADSKYRELLEKAGAKVDALDLSLWSALRANGQIGDAERLMDYIKQKYDHYFAFEPASLFMASGGPIRAILALTSALNVAEKVHILYHHEPYTSIGTHVDFETFFEWLKRHFGVRYKVREYKVEGGKVLSVATLDADDQRRRELLEFARHLHRAITMGFPPAYHRMIRTGDRIADTNAVTYDIPEKILEDHIDQVIKRLKQMRWKNQRVLDILRDIGKVYYETYRNYKF